MTSLCQITCGACGHQADYLEFTRTPLFGDLPKDTFQCPKCKTSIKRTYGTPTVYDTGYVAPGPMSLDIVEARL